MASDDVAALTRHGDMRIPLAYWFVGIVPPQQWLAATGSTIVEKWQSLPAPHTAEYPAADARALAAAGAAMRTSVAAAFKRYCSRRSGRRANCPR